MILEEFDPILEKLCILESLDQRRILFQHLILLHLAVVLQLLHRQHASPQRVQQLLNRLEDVQQVHELVIVGVEWVDAALRKEKLHVLFDTTADVSHHNIKDRFVEELVDGIFEQCKFLDALNLRQLLIEHHRSRFSDFLNENLVRCLQFIDNFFDF